MKESYFNRVEGNGATVIGMWAVHSLDTCDGHILSTRYFEDKKDATWFYYQQVKLGGYYFTLEEIFVYQSGACRFINPHPKLITG